MASPSPPERPAPWYDPPPAGFHFEALPDGEWEIDGTRRCRRGATRNKPGCGKQSAAVLWRKHGKDGRRRWPYCAEHMFGRWLEGGQVMCWILKADDDG